MQALPSAAGLGLTPIACAFASRVSSDRRVARRPRQIVPSHQVSLRRPRVIPNRSNTHAMGLGGPRAARSGRGHAKPRRGQAEPFASARDPRPPPAPHKLARHFSQAAPSSSAESLAHDEAHDRLGCARPLVGWLLATQPLVSCVRSVILTCTPVSHPIQKKNLVGAIRTREADSAQIAANITAV